MIVLRTLGTAALLVVGSVSLHGQQPAAPIPAPFDSIQLTAVQRAAIDADWAQRKAALSAITARMRAAGRITDADRAELKRFAEARNTVVRGILTADQRTQLDRNLVRITEARRQQALTGQLLRRGAR